LETRISIRNQPEVLLGQAKVIATGSCSGLRSVDFGVPIGGGVKDSAMWCCCASGILSFVGWLILNEY